jgi:hypothetical protein
MKATESQIKQWQALYEKVFEYSVKDGERELRAYFHSPSLQVLDLFERKYKTSPLEADDAVINNCWIDGDEEIRAKDKYKAGLRDWLGMLIVKVEGELKELSA